MIDFVRRMLLKAPAERLGLADAFAHRWVGDLGFLMAEGGGGREELAEYFRASLPTSIALAMEALDESDGDGSDDELEEEIDLSRARGKVVSS